MNASTDHSYVIIFSEERCGWSVQSLVTVPNVARYSVQSSCCYWRRRCMHDRLMVALIVTCKNLMSLQAALPASHWTVADQTASVTLQKKVTMRSALARCVMSLWGRRRPGVWWAGWLSSDVVSSDTFSSTWPRYRWTPRRTWPAERPSWRATVRWTAASLRQRPCHSPTYCRYTQPTSTSTRSTTASPIQTDRRHFRSPSHDISTTSWRPGSSRTPYRNSSLF